MYPKYAKLRDEKGFTDYSVAKETGIPESTIYDWRQRSAKDNSTRLSVDNLLKVAKLFGVSIEYFLEVDGEKGNK